MTSPAVVAASERVLTLLREPVVPAVGVHPGTPFELYHAWDAASNSRLSILRRSPAHLRAYLDHGDDSKALLIGRACHSAILEPDEFTRRYLESERCEGVTKAKERCKNPGIIYNGSQGWLCGVHGSGIQTDPGITILTPPDYQCAVKVRDAVYAHRAAALLVHGQRELSIAWDDTKTGLRCKARLDHHTPTIAGGAIVDIKTTKDASPRVFERAIYDYGYHRQGAFYLDGAKSHQLPVEHFAIIAVEKEPPYCVAIYRLTEGALDAGAEQIAPLLERYAHCLSTNEWPGYSDEVQDLALPTWAWDQIAEEATA